MNLMRCYNCFIDQIIGGYMNNTLKQLWQGNISPAEGFTKNNDSIRCTEALIYRDTELFKSTLNDTQQSAFDALMRKMYDYVNASSEQAFTSGFSLATCLISEAITKCSGNMTTESH